MVEYWCTHCWRWAREVSGRPRSAPPSSIVIQTMPQTSRQALTTLEAGAEECVNLHAQGKQQA